MIGLHDVGNAALARLGVDADDRLVVAAHVLWIDGQVGDLPDSLAQFFPRDLGIVRAGADGGRQCIEALVDGVLVGTGKGGKDQLAAIGVALRHAQLVAVFDGLADLRQIGEVNLWVHALGEHVQAQGDEIDVAGALAVAKQAALDAVRAGQIAQLGGGDTLTAVVVRV